MKILNGIDIIEIHRIKKAIERGGQPFLDKIYTQGEQKYCDNRGKQRFASYAARFAVKEAVSKAFGTGFGKAISPPFAEVINNKNGKPLLELSGPALETYNKLKCISLDISLSHNQEHAVAVVTILTE